MEVGLNKKCSVMSIMVSIKADLGIRLALMLAGQSFAMLFNAHYDTEPLSLWGRFLAGLATQPEKKWQAQYSSSSTASELIHNLCEQHIVLFLGGFVRVLGWSLGHLLLGPKDGFCILHV